MIWLVSAAYGRYATTRVALAQWRDLCDQTGADAVLVAGDGNLAIADEYGFHTVKRDNSDVSGRFNAGIQYALDHGAQVVVYTGSDNWIHPDVLTRPPAGRELVTGSLIQVVDVPGRRRRLCKVDTTYGVIPWLIPRTLLEPCQGEPFEPGHRRGFDTLLIEGLTRANGWPPTFTRFDPHPFGRVDLKTEENLTSYDRLTGWHGVGEDEEPWQALTAYYPPWLVEFAEKEFTG